MHVLTGKMKNGDPVTVTHDDLGEIDGGFVARHTIVLDGRVNGAATEKQRVAEDVRILDSANVDIYSLRYPDGAVAFWVPESPVKKRRLA